MGMVHPISKLEARWQVGLLAAAAGEHLYYVRINERRVRCPAPTNHQSASDYDH